MRPRAFLAGLALMLSAASTAGPRERLSDPAQETRAHALFRQFRCLVCQNESIDDSDAPLAADLRGLVRSDVAAGRTDGEIRRTLVDRYGEFVLLKPRMSGGNAALWLPPFVILLAGGAAFAVRARSRRDLAEPDLTEAERARVSELAATATVPPPSRPTDTTAAM